MSEARAFGSRVVRDGVRFEVPAPEADAVDLCLFPQEGAEARRFPMTRQEDGVFVAHVQDIGPGQAYGYRAHGPFDSSRNLFFDPAKLLADPWTIRLDRAWKWHEDLATRAHGRDTAALVPKSVVEVPALDFGSAMDSQAAARLPKPCFRPGGLIYELNVRGFTMQHPEIPQGERGTLSALTHPSIIAHLRRLRVDAVELMPVAAWIDERHLARIGLSNSWGYNPATFLALDPRLAPGGIADLRRVTDRLRQEGISVILDVVFNHTGESDAGGPTLSFRGLFNREAYLRDSSGAAVNVTGTGNTVACNHPLMRGMILDALRHFVLNGGVDGFRFDLATVLGRTDRGFDPHSPLIREMIADPVVGSRILIAEPWDVGPGGYQLGNFPEPFLEWNDRYRDGMRRYWRGDGGMRGEFATRLSGSSDIFRREEARATRSVSFIAAHDGFALADLVAYASKHNEANGEANRDGHSENLSWNNGAEGQTSDPAVTDARRRDIRALLSTLFLSRGTILLTAGDEMGRTQNGNNNAYCQDNGLTWIDWEGMDGALLAHAAGLAELRASLPALHDAGFLAGLPGAGGVADIEWLDRNGDPMTPGAWHGTHDPCLAILMATGADAPPRLAILVNPLHEPVTFSLPEGVGILPGESALGRGPAIVVKARTVEVLSCRA